MADDNYEAEPRKGTVEVGSGDFQPNPIYGDAPQSYGDGTTYEDDNQNQIGQNGGDQDYEYPQNDENQYEDEDANNPFAEQQQNDQTQQGYDNQQQQQQAQYGDNQQYGNDGGQEQANAPPPYSEEAPAPPPAYGDPNQQQTYGNGGTNEPEDVVAQMAADTQQDEDVGDYGVTQPKTEDGSGDEDEENGEGLFGNFFIRTIYMASSLWFTSILGFRLFMGKQEFLDLFDDALDTGFGTGLGLSGFAVFMIFLGSMMAMVWAIMNKMGRPIPFEKWIIWSIVGVYITGGLFLFLGGCAVAYSWNKLGGELKDAGEDSAASYFSAVAGSFFVEETFIGLHTILAGVDIFRRKWLNNKKIRVIVYNTLWFFLALVAFFSYAIQSTQLDKNGEDNAGPAVLALFYFLAMIPQVIYVVIFIIPAINEKLGKPIILLILAGSFLLCAICVLIGYFVLISVYEDALKGRGWYVGVGFFVLLTGTAISFDMLFDRFIPGYKDGGSSVADQEAQGGTVPTTNPDSQEEY